ncbi:hypothetical protein ACCS67_34735, partial [Rhizobium brockwellii]
VESGQGGRVTRIRDIGRVELGAAYGPGLLNESEKGLTIAEMMRQRLGGKADYADRVRLGSIIIIVRDLDEHDHITSVVMSLEAVEP